MVVFLTIFSLKGFCLAFMLVWADWVPSEGYMLSFGELGVILLKFLLHRHGIQGKKNQIRKTDRILAFCLGN